LGIGAANLNENSIATFAPSSLVSRKVEMMSAKALALSGLQIPFLIYSPAKIAVCKGI